MKNSPQYLNGLFALFLIIPFSICGKSTDDSWVSEGRRIAPIIQRGIPQTAFLLDADAVAKKIASFSFELPKKVERSETSAEREEANEKSDTVLSAKPVESVNKSVS